MDSRCCPCGVRLNRSSAVRPLKSPCLRMFMSMRTMKSLTSEAKICNVCRMLYKKWKNENSEFSSILTRLEHDMMVENDDDDNSVFVFSFFFNVLNILSIRAMLWMFMFKLMIVLVNCR